VKDAAQGVAVDVPQDVAQDLGFGARAARALLGSSSGYCHSWCRCWWRGPL